MTKNDIIVPFFLFPVVLCTCVAASSSSALVPVSASSALATELDRYHLTAGRFEHPGSPAVSYLLYAPKGSRLPRLPLVLFLPGSGEVGADLACQFHQRVIFERVTSPDFQSRHPCFFLVLSPPAGTTTLLGGLPGHPSTMQRLLDDALLAVACSRSRPAVDTNRLYVTGLSFGGNGAYALALAYPGRFAAAVPIASLVMPSEWIATNAPGAWWHFYNEDDYRRHGIDPSRLKPFRRRVGSLGGDFRVGTYPDAGHNAWDKAWREDAVWDWMFSKTADGKGTERPDRGRAAAVQPRADLAGATCSASVEGRDEKTTPDRAADGLDATCYVSKEPVGRGGWWQVEFVAPVSGAITVFSGTREGADRLSRGRVEVSHDGKSWFRAGSFAKATGACAFVQRAPVRFLRVVSEASRPETLTLREVSVETR